jgi:hypothetical protein
MYYSTNSWLILSYNNRVKLKTKYLRRIFSYACAVQFSLKIKKKRLQLYLHPIMITNTTGSLTLKSFSIFNKTDTQKLCKIYFLNV